MPDNLEKGNAINSEYFIEFFSRMNIEITEIPHMFKKQVLFLQDNAPCHKSMATMVQQNELNFELFPKQRILY